MSNILSRQQWRLIQRWFTPDQARRIAYNQQVKNGNVIQWTYTLTEKGKQYSELEPRSRARFRYAKATWKQFDDTEIVDWKARTKKTKIRFKNKSV